MRFSLATGSSSAAWVVNDELFAADRIDAFPQFGTTEIWRFINKSGGWLHPIHPHLVEFRMLDRNGQPPKPYETGPKDVVALGPNETIRVAMKFVDFRGTYVFHCHNIEHEDHDMMTQFQVV
jgi:FtsP/CotA-like multicopper oxidase with cupredoxin domain